MKKMFTRCALLLVLFSALSQCVTEKTSVAPAMLSAEQLAADTSFVRVVTIGNNFQSVVYNTLRDAHSQVKRKQENVKIQRLLNQENKDSLILAIKVIGFKDVGFYLNSLSALQSATAQLQRKNIFLDKLAPGIGEQAWQLVSSKKSYVYPPIKEEYYKAVTGSQHSKTNSPVVCETCFMNNCDECTDFGGDNSGTIFTYPNSDGGGVTCRQAAENKRQASITQAQMQLAASVTVACGAAGFTAAETACGATAVTILGAPISPATGAGVGCVVYVGCSIYALYQYRLQLTVIESDYTMALAGCK